MFIQCVSHCLLLKDNYNLPFLGLQNDRLISCCWSCISDPFQSLDRMPLSSYNTQIIFFLCLSSNSEMCAWPLSWVTSAAVVFETPHRVKAPTQVGHLIFARHIAKNLPWYVNRKGIKNWCLLDKIFLGYYSLKTCSEANGCSSKVKSCEANRHGNQHVVTKHIVSCTMALHICIKDMDWQVKCRTWTTMKHNVKVQ